MVRLPPGGLTITLSGFTLAGFLLSGFLLAGSDHRER
jgi:hypothetical protein